MLTQAESEQEKLQVLTKHNYDELKMVYSVTPTNSLTIKLERLNSEIMGNKECFMMDNFFPPRVISEWEKKALVQKRDLVEDVLTERMQAPIEEKRREEKRRGALKREPRTFGEYTRVLRTGASKREPRTFEEYTRVLRTGALESEIRELVKRTGALEEEIPPLKEEARALEMFLSWVMDDGKEALKLAENVLKERKVKPTDIKQHVEQLLKSMDRDYRLNSINNCRTPLPSHEKIFKTMLEEIPKLIGMQQRLGLRYLTLEDQFQFNKISRLSSWTPSTTHNNNLHELLRDALMMLKDLGGYEEYHENLRDFMKQHTAFCAFTLDNAKLITAEDSKATAELCKNLRRLAQNLGKIASAKAEIYQKLYENFIIHKEDLSHWLDEASPGEGKLLYFKHRF